VWSGDAMLKPIEPDRADVVAALLPRIRRMAANASAPNH
jgi:hypothetical protein